MSELTPDESAELRSLQRKLFGERRDDDASEDQLARYDELMSLRPTSLAREPESSELGSPERRAPLAREAPAADVAPAVGSAMAIKTTPAWILKMREVSARKRLISVLAGAGVMCAIIGIGLGIAALLEPRPIFSAQASPVDTDDLPPGVVFPRERMSSAAKFDGWRTDMWLVELDQGMKCLSIESEDPTQQLAMSCSIDGEAIVFDYSPDLDTSREATAAEIADATFYRGVYKDGVLTLWDQAPTDRGAY